MPKRARPTEEDPSCSFCRKRSRRVRKLVAGPGVFICNECVALCVEILEVELGPDWRRPRRRAWKR